MNLLTRLLRRDSNEIARYSWDQYQNDISLAFQGQRYLLSGSPTGWAKTEDLEHSFTSYISGLYKSNGIVFAIILARMLLFTEARFCWFEINDNGEDGRPKGRAGLEVLEKPWPNCGTGELLARMEQDVSLGGNFYAVRDGNRLRRLRPDWVTIVLTAPPAESTYSDVAGYWYHPGRTYANAEPSPGDDVFLPDEVCHWSPLPDPDAQYRGMSWLAPVVREVMADKAARDHKLAFFENGATFGAIISAKESLTNAQYKEWKANFEGIHSGAANAYKSLFLASPVDTSVLSANMQQLDFKVVQGAGETRLCAAGGVPPIIVGLSEGLASATYSNYGMARRKFGDHWAHPQWKSASQALANLVDAPDDDVRLGVNTKGIAFLREDAKDLAEIQQIKASTLSTLIMAGYEPDSCQQAVEAEDLSLLKHTGLTSVQLVPPGTSDEDGDGVDDAESEYDVLLDEFRAELGDWDIDRARWNLRHDAGTVGGGQFRKLSDAIVALLRDWDGVGDPFRDDDGEIFTQPQLKKAATQLGIDVPPRSSAPKIKASILKKLRGDAPDARPAKKAAPRRVRPQDIKLGTTLRDPETGEEAMVVAEGLHTVDIEWTANGETRRKTVRKQDIADFNDRQAPAKKATPRAPAKQAPPERATTRFSRASAKTGDIVEWRPEGGEPVRGTVDRQGEKVFIQWEGGRREQITAGYTMLSQLHRVEEGSPAPDRESAARQRQADIDTARKYSAVAGELSEFLDAEAGPEVTARRLRREGRKQGIDVEPIAEAVEQAREIEVENRIRAAYRAHPRGRIDSDRSRPLGFVPIADIRRELGDDVSADEITAALRRMADERRRDDPGVMTNAVRLTPQEDQKRLTAADRAGAVQFGGHAMHWLTIDDPSDRPDASRLMADLLASQGIVQDDSGARFDPSLHEPVGSPIRQGAPVQVVRPGFVLERDGEKIRVAKAVVEAVDEPASDSHASRRERAEKIRQDKGIPFVEGQTVQHSNRGPVTFLFPDDADPTGKTVWVRFDDGNEGMVSTHMLSAIESPDPLSDLRTLDPEAARDALDLRTVAALKDLIRQANERDGVKLPVSGRKRDLVDRLVGHLHPQPDVTPELRREIEVENRIRAAYRAVLADRPARRRGDKRLLPWVSMADLRDRLDTDLSRDEVDHVLDRMIEQPDVRLQQELNQRALTDRDRAASVVIGNQERDIIQIGDPSDRPLPGHLHPGDSPTEAREPRRGAFDASAVAGQVASAQSEADVITLLASDPTLTAAKLRKVAEHLGIDVPESIKAKSALQLLIAEEEARQRNLPGGFSRSEPLDPDDIERADYEDPGEPDDEMRARAQACLDDCDEDAEEPDAGDYDMFRAAGADTNLGGERLHYWWTKGPGLARWANSPHPWTALYTQLREHVGAAKAKRMASAWFHEVFGIWSGERKGDNPVGPG